MALPPPPGYGIHARTYRPTSGNHTAVNTFGFRNVGGFTASAAQNAISTALSSTGAPYNNTKLDSDWICVQVYTLINSGGVLSSFTQPVGTAGTATQESPPPNVSLVVKKTTAIAGRQYRGRIALPAGFLSESSINDAGIYNSTGVTTQQAAFLQAFNDANTASVPLYLLHGPDHLGVTPAPTAMTAFVVSPLVGTQRRRLRR